MKKKFAELNKEIREKISVGLDSRLSHTAGDYVVGSKASQANRISDIINSYVPKTSLLENLDRDGYVYLGRVLNSVEVQNLHALLEKTPVYSAHVKPYSDGVLRSREETTSRLSCYDPQQLMNSSELLSLVLNKFLIDLATQYLGCIPTVYSMNCFYSDSSIASGPPESLGTNSFHRDNDDFRYLSLFVYLDDVNEQNGAHEYKVGSHKSLDGESVILSGKAGDAFISNPYGLHRGMPLVSGTRNLVWIRYGLYDNWVHYNDQNNVYCIDEDNLNRELSDSEKFMLRLFLKADEE